MPMKPTEPAPQRDAAALALSEKVGGERAGVCR